MKRKLTGGDLAQFYTRIEIAKYLISRVAIDRYKRVIEPSAGDGAFSLQIPNCESYDIDPKHSSITQADFLSLPLTTNPTETLFIGNPPFGKQASLAFKFIKKCCLLGDTIAFILPLSFIKVSMQDRVPLTHTCVYEEILNEDSFLFEGKPYPLPCVFQIWERTKVLREKHKIPQVIDFEFSQKEDTPDLWFRRVGFYAGTFGTDWEKKSIQSHYFLKCKNKNKVERILSLLKWKHHNTVGAKSISKYELIMSYLEGIDKLI